MRNFLAKPRKKTIKNQVDEQGHRHGRWESYWENGALLYKGDFMRGKQHGPWERYNDEGKPSWKGELKNGRYVGLWYEKKFN